MKPSPTKRRILSNAAFLERITASDASVFVFFRELSRDDSRNRRWDSLTIQDNSAMMIPVSFGVPSGVIRFTLTHKNTTRTFDYMGGVAVAGTAHGQKQTVALAEFIDLGRFNKKRVYRLLTVHNFESLILHARVRSGEWTDLCWTEVRTAGVIIKMKKYSWRYSDFGSDNLQLKIMADSSYLGFRKPVVFILDINPRSYDKTTCVNDEGRRALAKDGRLARAFDYMFDSRQLVLVNYDDMPYREYPEPRDYLDSEYGAMLGFSPRSRTSLNPDMKFYPIPADIRAMCFILSKDDLGMYERTDVHTVYGKVNGDVTYEEVLTMNEKRWIPRPNDLPELADKKIKAELVIPAVGVFEGIGTLWVRTRDEFNEIAVVAVFEDKSVTRAPRQYRFFLSPQQLQRIHPAQTADCDFVFDGLLEPDGQERSRDSSLRKK